jgi:putative endonuclease
MAAKDDLGRAGEDRAVAHLTTCGYRILDRNWRCPQGELDIVAEFESALCFIEVKTRRGTGFGHPFDAVDERKRRRLWQLAYAWARAHPQQSTRRTLRIDVIGIIGPDPVTGSLEHLVDLR